MSVGTMTADLKRLFEANPLFKPARDADVNDRHGEEKKREEEAKRVEAEEQAEYERQWRIDHATEIKAAEDFKVRFSALAQRLGFTPKVDPENSERWNLVNQDVRATREGGASLHFSSGSYRGVDGKVNISGRFEDARGRGFDNGENPGSINISLNKTDDQIASEFQRRLLPYLENGIKKVTARLSQADANENARTILVGDAAKILGLKVSNPYGDNKYPSVDKYVNGTVESVSVKTDYNGKEATIEVRVKKEAMAGILQAIKAAMDIHKDEEE